MRSLSLAFILSIVAVTAGASPATGPSKPSPLADAMEQYDALLSRYVSPDGVRYRKWKSSPDDRLTLRQVIGLLEKTDSEKLAGAARYALFINLYNAKVLDLVLDGDPPKSIKDLSRGINPYQVFTRKSLNLGGEFISLVNLEGRLRKESEDPRVHFAVNCASRSCPPIAGESYRSETLNEQLDRATRAFLAAPGSVAVKEGSTWLGRSVLEVSVSRIFKWYAKDFKVRGGVIKFLMDYSPEKIAGRIREAGDRVRLQYQEYDWNLNSAP
jgi:hypothetical protein